MNWAMQGSVFPMRISGSGGFEHSAASSETFAGRMARSRPKSSPRRGRKGNSLGPLFVDRFAPLGVRASVSIWRVPREEDLVPGTVTLLPRSAGSHESAARPRLRWVCAEPGDQGRIRPRTRGSREGYGPMSIQSKVPQRRMLCCSQPANATGLNRAAAPALASPVRILGGLPRTRSLPASFQHSEPTRNKTCSNNC